jgi:tRNA dimethylallyltransferase
MLAAGALEEARRAFERSPDPEAPGWSGIGCAELLAHMLGTLALEDAKALWLRRTRAYAKRQLTWFRRDPEIVWFRPGEEEKMLAVAEAFLNDRA